MLKALKLLFTKELLRDSDITVNDVAIRLGYNQTSSFIRKLKQCENITPNEYRMTFCIKERYEKINNQIRQQNNHEA